VSSVGFVRAARLIAAKDLQLEWRTLDTLASSLIFSLIVLVVFSFAFDLATVRQLGAARLVPGVIWITLAFAAVVGMTRSFALERQRDSLSALFLAPIDRGALFAGKFLANLVKLVVLQLAVAVLTALLFDYDLAAIALRMAGVLLLHGVGLTALGTLFAAISVRVGRGEALLATLLLPASTPLFISAVKCTAALLEHGALGPVRNWVLLTAGFDGMYLVLAVLTFEFVLED